MLVMVVSPVSGLRNEGRRIGLRDMPAPLMRVNSVTMLIVLIIVMAAVWLRFGVMIMLVLVSLGRMILAIMVALILMIVSMGLR
jgi:hypothetical protein